LLRVSNAENVAGLVEEYRTLFEEADSASFDSLEDTLVRAAEWTPEAAAHLLRLATQYGSFMLRNALAISLALDIEDGELGF
jgi:hypothetical protein